MSAGSLTPVCASHERPGAPGERKRNRRGSFYSTFSSRLLASLKGNLNSQPFQPRKFLQQGLRPIKTANSLPGSEDLRHSEVPGACVATSQVTPSLLELASRGLTSGSLSHSLGGPGGRRPPQAVAAAGLLN